MISGPKVCICVPSYNCESTIERAIHSALEQTVPCHIVVVDDCSTDDTVGKLSVFENDSLVTVIKLSENSGPSYARNVAIAASNEPWVALLDSDDFLEPHRMESLLKKAESNNLDFVADNLYRVSENDIGGQRNQLWSESRYSENFQLELREFVQANLSTTQAEHRVELGFIKPLMRREFLEQYDLSYDQSMRLGEDYDLYARALSLKAKFYLVDSAGYIAVERASSLSGQHSTEDLKGLLESDTRLLGSPNLTREEKKAIEVHRIDTHKRWAWRRFLDTKKQRDFIALVKIFKAPLPVIFYVVREVSIATFSNFRPRTTTTS
ncbi:MAG: glycosyltransferase family 2 protein [bacterium]